MPQLFQAFTAMWINLRWSCLGMFRPGVGGETPYPLFFGMNLKFFGYLWNHHTHTHHHHLPASILSTAFGGVRYLWINLRWSCLRMFRPGVGGEAPYPLFFGMDIIYHYFYSSLISLDGFWDIRVDYFPRRQLEGIWINFNMKLIHYVVDITDYFLRPRSRYGGLIS